MKTREWKCYKCRARNGKYFGLCQHCHAETLEEFRVQIDPQPEKKPEKFVNKLLPPTAGD
ncbi:MAG: hypothetical protein HYT69_00585 [Candidatus Zambryskibacteria bacterium]|nr:hypothetical protein [Candidatus Zambryskibacteria bacterium]